MRLSLTFFIAGFIAIAGCNSPSGSTNKGTVNDSNINKKEIAAVPQSKLNDAGTQMLLAQVNKYYDLKDALVKTNAYKADSSAAQLLVVTDSLQVFLQKDNANQAALKPYLDTIQNQSKTLLALKDETCERQRVPFEKISDMMFLVLKNAGLKNANVYQQFCPMAFNEKGAHWLSNESEIKNPYFGKKMIECGDVTDSLK